MRFCAEKKQNLAKKNVAKKLILFQDIAILQGGWKMSLAQILIKLKTLSLSMILRTFLIFWRFGAL